MVVVVGGGMGEAHIGSTQLTLRRLSKYVFLVPSGEMLHDGVSA